MSFFQNIELMALDGMSLFLLLATIYALVRLPWSFSESEKVGWTLKACVHAFVAAFLNDRPIRAETIGEQVY